MAEHHEVPNSLSPPSQTINFASNHSPTTQTQRSIIPERQSPTRTTGLGNNRQSEEQGSDDYNLKLNLRINRVDSKEYKERQERRKEHQSINENLTYSLVSKPFSNLSHSRLPNSVEKRPVYNYASQKEVGESFQSNYSNKERATYSSKFRYSSYKNEGNLNPHYEVDRDSDHGSIVEKEENGQGSYRRRIEDLGIGTKMISSVISRDSDGRNSGYVGNRYNLRTESVSSRGRYENTPEDEAYELYNSRHPSESIRKSTIEISKAISSNAITELKNQNENQEKKIKKQERQLEELRSSLAKLEDSKHQNQVDIESKAREIFDLSHKNKRLDEEVQNLRTYRTMETVEQVIITRLKEEIMLLNKRIIEMQAEHYKSQKLLIERSQKNIAGKDTDKGNDEDMNKEKYIKLEINLDAEKKRTELLNEELTKEKEKSWQFQKEKEQVIAQKSLIQEKHDTDLSEARKEISHLHQEIQKQIESSKNVSRVTEESKIAFEAQLKQLNSKIKSIEEENNRTKNSLLEQLSIKQSEVEEKSKAYESEVKNKRSSESELGSKMEEMKVRFEKELNAKLEEQLIVKEKEFTIREQEQIRKHEIELQSILQTEISKNNERFSIELGTQLKDQKAKIENQYISQLENERQRFDVEISNQIHQLETLHSQSLAQQKQNYEIQISTQNSSQVSFEAQLKEQQRQHAQEIERLKQNHQNELSNFTSLQKQTFENELSQKLLESEQRWSSKLIEETQKSESKLASKLNEKENQLIKERDEIREKLIGSEKFIQEISSKLVEREEECKNSQKQVQVIVQQETVKIEKDLLVKFEKDLREKNQEFQNRNTELQQKNSELEKKLSEVNKKTVEYTERISQFTSQEQKHKEEQQSFSHQLSELSKEKSLLESQLKSQQVSQQNSQEFETKYQSAVSQLNELQTELSSRAKKYEELEQEYKKSSENLNVWKVKVESLERSKTDVSNLEREREELKMRIKDLEEGKVSRNQLVVENEKLNNENEILKQKIKIKEDELQGREATFSKLKSYYDSEELRSGNFTKQIKAMENKVIDTEAKLKTILSKVEADENKYKEIVNKMQEDSETYTSFMIKLQNENEATYQKYLKIKKQARDKKLKIIDDDTKESVDYSIFRQYLEKEVSSNFMRVIVPNFEAKVKQKIDACEANLVARYKKLIGVKYALDVLKRKRSQSR